jgi:hypothetical protein
MLHAKRRLEVTNGAYITINPEAHLAWPEALPIFTPQRRLRVVYYDQGHRISARTAEQLIACGVAVRGPATAVAPDLPPAQYDLAASWIGRNEQDGRGINYGCGNGTLMAEMAARGLKLDGVDGDESLVMDLAAVVPGDALVMMADIAECAFPRQYGYAVAGPQVLQRLPSWSALRRHLRLAAISVRPGGCYLAHIDPDLGPRSQQTLRNDPVERMSLVKLSDSRLAVLLAAELGEWQDFFGSAEGWEIAHVAAAGDKGYWFSLARR